MIRSALSRRFVELEASFAKLPFDPVDGYPRATHVPSGKWEQWATSAQNLIRAVFGEPSPHYQNFISAYKACRGEGHEVRVLQGIFLSAKEDYEGGYVFDVDLRVSGEVFSDFVLLAKESLANGYKDVAAVLACAALEDALKRYAASQGVDTANRSMQEVINALKAGGHVAGAQKGLLDAMPRVRNAALHAEWSKISELEVSSVLGFVEQFLLSKFGDI